MPPSSEYLFYETMWRRHAHRPAYPVPWWCQQYFRAWSDEFDSGLFDSREAAFAANANHRYWHMVGVKDHTQESLIGQAGEVEPVYECYAVSAFLFDPATRALHLPQFPRDSGRGRPLEQFHEDDHLPIVHTLFRAPGRRDLVQTAHATVLGSRERSVVVLHLTVRPADAGGSDPAWLCLSVSPTGPTGFQRRDKAGRYAADKQLTQLRWLAAEERFELNTRWGPILGTAPDHVGCYGNAGRVADPDHYLAVSPYRDLADRGLLNGATEATDHLGGLCEAVVAWEVPALGAGDAFHRDVYLPVDDYRGDDIAEFHAADPEALAAANRSYWLDKLTAQGAQFTLPAPVAHLGELYRLCRAQLLILADHGQIHPGPTIYDSFWVRDSSVEGIACALAGDGSLAERQFGTHYPGVFHRGGGWAGPVRLHGFFGGEHEIQDREWDSNGQALWAVGRFDRVQGAPAGFGAGLYWPYVLEGARWIRDNRSPFGLLHSGWSAEHVGDKHQPHYWDDLWGLAGLWEAAQLATRIGAAEVQELWDGYDSLRVATANSIRWVLGEQRRRGHWQTFVPTGPGDVGRLDSTMIGAVAYFHPCRLYVGSKLGADVDLAFRLTLDTIWSHFVDGGFRHDAAWHCYGPYLTLQLAHAFLLTGDVARMDHLLTWVAGHAGFPRVSRDSGLPGDTWDVALGTWNEQHSYPVAKDFAEIPSTWWYMGDIPHGWACAELMLLVRDILFYEVDEDHDPHLYLAPGVMPHWLTGGGSVGVEAAPDHPGRPPRVHAGARRHGADPRPLHHDAAAGRPVVRGALPLRRGGRRHRQRRRRRGARARRGAAPRDDGGDHRLPLNDGDGPRQLRAGRRLQGDPGCVT